MAFSPVLTPGSSPFWDLASLRTVVLDLNVTSYTNPGGETLTPNLFGMNRLLGAFVISGIRGFVYEFVQSGVNLKLTIAQDAAVAAAAALPEIPNTNNHGTVRVFAIGQ